MVSPNVGQLISAAATGGDIWASYIAWGGDPDASLEAARAEILVAVEAVPLPAQALKSEGIQMFRWVLFGDSSEHHARDAHWWVIPEGMAWMDLLEGDVLRMRYPWDPPDLLTSARDEFGAATLRPDTAKLGRIQTLLD